tara:strand:- start:6399 stop:7508 length:1110 start_codon:yes stop_codon:yes gene_type:complete
MPKSYIPWSKPKIFKGDKINLNKAINSTWISGGDFVEKFENEISKSLHTKYVACVSNGTAAIHATFLALNLKKGDEILIPGFGYLAAANIAHLMGLKIKFVDVDYDTFCMNYSDLKKKISKSTRVVVFIHTYGNGGDIIKISKFLKTKKVILIEDAAEALGSRIKSKYLGTIGDIGTFSFHATKNITTGEGGCVVSKDKNFIEKVKLFRSHGVKSKRYFHFVPGHNFRLTNLQAAIGFSQIKKIKKIINKRKWIYKIYLDLFKKLNMKNFFIQKIQKNIDFVPWTLAINLNNYSKKSRDKIIFKMMKKKVETRNGFYFPNKLPMYKKIKNLQNSLRLSNQVICLPFFFDLDEKMIKKIIETLKVCLKNE